jgi:hydroxyacyl-ACP dehydratase HTD2-like protein with hotdog domain
MKNLIGNQYYKMQVIDGRTKDRKIREDVDILMLSSGVGLEGIDLTNFEEMYILTNLWSPALLDQLTARIWRGDKRNFEKPIYLITSTSEHDRIKELVNNKKYEVIAKLMDR